MSQLKPSRIGYGPCLLKLRLSGDQRIANILGRYSWELQYTFWATLRQELIKPSCPSWAFSLQIRYYYCG
jgi:hypothetical protein